MAEDTRARTARTHPVGPKIPERAKVGEHLARLAASNLVLYYKTKAAHWTVSGPIFWQVHKLLDKLAGTFFDAIDPLAERCRQIETLPALSLAAAKGIAVVEDRQKENLGNREMLEALNADCTRLSELYVATAKLTDEIDPGSNNLVTDLLDKHDSVAWFLRETLVKGGDVEL
jgi:starvation-inducible DNA-binding protein